MINNKLSQYKQMKKATKAKFSKSFFDGEPYDWVLKTRIYIHIFTLK